MNKSNDKMAMEIEKYEYVENAVNNAIQEAIEEDKCGTVNRGDLKCAEILWCVPKPGVDAPFWQVTIETASPDDPTFQVVVHDHCLERGIENVVIKIPDYSDSFIPCWTDVIDRMEASGWCAVKITFLPGEKYHVKFWRETPVLMCVEGFGDTRDEAVLVTALNAVAALNAATAEE